ncbi:MAG TPA: translocase [Myxococcaceae bacterium]|nr:translocase [Myxococcaceae bacterium]
MAEPALQTGDDRITWLDRALRPFADVRACEAATALVLAGTIFTILTAYYLLKVIREPFILIGGGAEVKSYAAAGQALLLIPVLKVHGAIASRVGRLKLIAAVLLFCAASLLVFWFLTRAGAAIGVPFYLWVGTFNVILTATFWSFANDVYTPEQGKRLFPILGIGMSVGALAGAGLAGRLLRVLDPQALMLIAAGLLVACLGMFAYAHTHDRCWPKDRGKLVHPSEPIRGAGGFRTVLSDRYLILIAVMVILTNWVTNGGEYVLDRTLLAAGHESGLSGPALTKFIGAFKADYFWWFDLLGVLSQFFLVSRILKYLGVGGALLILPAVALTGNTLMMLLPVLGLIRVAKITERSVEYSLQNTAQNALYLVVSRDAKYKAKAVIDSLLVRFGDVCAAGAILIGTQFGLAARGFAALNVVLAATWLMVAWRVRAVHRQRLGDVESPGALTGQPAVQSA